MPPRRVHGATPNSGALKGLVEPKLLPLDASLLVLAYMIPAPMRSTVLELI
jgi:hypothetical protein